jgi:alkanesulfonate monooxygenase SsuD/methylene tetrahydromethanopterin reductase-like flavin-dependent oxidoreductase (luciferase family)
MELCDRIAVTPFRPALAPPGRLARLGVALDARNPAARLREIARMADRAGIDSLWVSDPSTRAAGDARLDALDAVAVVASEVSRARLGVMVDVSMRPPTVVVATVGPLAVALGGRLEIGFAAGSFEPHRVNRLRAPAEPAQPVPEGGLEGASTTPSDDLEPGEDASRDRRLTGYAMAVQSLLSGETARALERQDAREMGCAATSLEPGRPPVSIEMREPPDAAVAARVGDNVVMQVPTIRDLRGAIEQVRRECAVAGRDPSSLGIGVEIPVSIGRTSAEARARADAEPLFRSLGHPAEVGIFGTLEQCQDRVIALAHLGVTELRCVLPNSPDVHDVIAQLTAMVVGTARVLTPNAPRSRPPDPPAGWGGRPSRR